jgi:hypothetical protein
MDLQTCNFTFVPHMTTQGRFVHEGLTPRVLMYLELHQAVIMSIASAMAKAGGHILKASRAGQAGSGHWLWPFFSAQIEGAEIRSKAFCSSLAWKSRRLGARAARFYIHTSIWVRCRLGRASARLKVRFIQSLRYVPLALRRSYPAETVKIGAGRPPILGNALVSHDCFATFAWREFERYPTISHGL